MYITSWLSLVTFTSSTLTTVNLDFSVKFNNSFNPSIVSTFKYSGLYIVDYLAWVLHLQYKFFEDFNSWDKSQQ